MVWNCLMIIQLPIIGRQRVESSLSTVHFVNSTWIFQRSCCCFLHFIGWHQCQGWCRWYHILLDGIRTRWWWWWCGIPILQRRCWCGPYSTTHCFVGPKGQLGGITWVSSGSGGGVASRFPNNDGVLLPVDSNWLPMRCRLSRWTIHQLTVSMACWHQSKLRLHAVEVFSDGLLKLCGPASHIEVNFSSPWV